MLWFSPVWRVIGSILVILSGATRGTHLSCWSIAIIRLPATKSRSCRNMELMTGMSNPTSLRPLPIIAVSALMTPRPNHVLDMFFLLLVSACRICSSELTFERLYREMTIVSGMGLEPKLSIEVTMSVWSSMTAMAPLIVSMRCRLARMRQQARESRWPSTTPFGERIEVDTISRLPHSTNT